MVVLIVMVVLGSGKVRGLESTAPAGRTMVPFPPGEAEISMQPFGEAPASIVLTDILQLDRGGLAQIFRTIELLHVVAEPDQTLQRGALGHPDVLVQDRLRLPDPMHQLSDGHQDFLLARMPEVS